MRTYLMDNHRSGGIMNTVQMHDHEEVNEANFTYLLLAKQMIQQDMAAAMHCLGITAETAKLVASLNPAQLFASPS
jgi:flagellar transcriptional activator FlhD